MNYYSLNKQSPIVNFKQATIAGQAPDKGLYFPESIPQIEKEFFDNIEQYSNEEIAFKVIKPYVGNCIPDDELKRIVAETVNFNIPLVPINENIFSLELFHGPTLAFKDIGARFMSRCLGYFLKDNDKKVTVLVATSGDTGGAVANGFYNVDGVDVVVLYPSKKVSAVQEAQITTLGKNILALEVDGTFDDCQQMVKQAFTDAELNAQLFLTSANSINVARWLPQQFYYFFAYKQWKLHNKTEPIICVPSGNFGNICAGILAHVSGLPVHHFVAACNANKVVSDFLLTEKYQPKPSVATISNAMDVGNPSNFVRILEIFNQQFGSLKNVLSSYSINDDETKQTIKDVYQQYNYLLDPHGAVGYIALQRELQKDASLKGMILETAHPVKFNPAIIDILGENILAKKEAELLLNGNKQSTFMANDYNSLKEILLLK
ncbi:MAG: threonine synthase [Chitinophagaceae bacterium]|jgi:threonine synthase|nr:threonine synthase [Chitinophagaceae bacterium]